MRWRRIWAIVVRHLVQLPHDFNQWTSITFWPMLDILLFGCVGVWFDHSAHPAECAALRAGVTLWQFITRINFDISLSLLEEAWVHNAVNVFATPLNISEWAIGVIMKGIILGLLTLWVNGTFVWLVFGYNMLYIGWYLLYTIVQLFLSGVARGLFGAALLLRWGPRIQTIMFMLGFIALPISGAFYPVAILPSWLQSIAYIFPFAYIFEGLYFFLYHSVWYISYIVS